MSHFNAKKLYLLKARENPDRTISENELVATLKVLYKNECNIESLDAPILTEISDGDSEKAGDDVIVGNDEKRLAIESASFMHQNRMIIKLYKIPPKCSEL